MCGIKYKRGSSETLRNVDIKIKRRMKLKKYKRKLRKKLKEKKKDIFFIPLK